ncbi:acyclic terpene utilization AtuA family protein, partial [Acinetobacter baumannii]
MKDPAQGYARDFVEVMAPLLAEVKAQGIKVISNAGGMNVGACRDALAAAAEAAGVTLRIAVVEGEPVVAEFETGAWLRYTVTAETAGTRALTVVGPGGRV